jgi:hypothetical protein
VLVGFVATTAAVEGVAVAAPVFVGGGATTFVAAVVAVSVAVGVADAVAVSVAVGVADAVVAAVVVAGAVAVGGGSAFFAETDVVGAIPSPSAVS